MTKKTIRTPQQRIEFYQQKIKELQLKMKGKSVVLDKNTKGMKEALDALSFIVTTHKVSMGQVIKTISSLKRTGLRIQDPAPKVRKSKSTTVSN